MARTPEEQADFDLVTMHFERVSVLVDSQGYDGLPEHDKLIYSIWWLEGDVNNGGFDQYFFNSYGNYVADAIRGLEVIGAKRAASIVVRATMLFPRPGPSPDRHVRQNQLDAMDEAVRAQFARLDEAFLEYPDDIERLMASYLRGQRR